jgi:hypothetical protein
MAVATTIKTWNQPLSRRVEARPSRLFESVHNLGRSLSARSAARNRGLFALGAFTKNNRPG